MSALQDKVNISVAIIPMAQDFGWSPTTSGFVQSSFFFGYMLSQIPGGYVVSRAGGRRILPVGVGLWSAATAAVPVLAGSMPGEASSWTSVYRLYTACARAQQGPCPSLAAGPQSARMSGV